MLNNSNFEQKKVTKRFVINESPILNHPSEQGPLSQTIKIHYHRLFLLLVPHNSPSTSFLSSSSSASDSSILGMSLPTPLSWQHGSVCTSLLDLLRGGNSFKVSGLMSSWRLLRGAGGFLKSEFRFGGHGSGFMNDGSSGSCLLLRSRDRVLVRRLDCWF